MPAISADPSTAGRSDEEQIVDADGLRAYRLALARNAMQFKVYPAQALARHESGTARLRVRIAGGLSITLVASSGVDSLDRQAQQMLAQATAVTPVPDSLQGTSFTFELPVEFDAEASQ